MVIKFVELLPKVKYPAFKPSLTKSTYDVEKVYVLTLGQIPCCTGWPHTLLFGTYSMTQNAQEGSVWVSRLTQLGNIYTFGLLMVKCVHNSHVWTSLLVLMAIPVVGRLEIQWGSIRGPPFQHLFLHKWWFLVREKNGWNIQKLGLKPNKECSLFNEEVMKNSIRTQLRPALMTWIGLFLY